MKPLYRNLFLLFGVAAIIVMLLTFDVDYTQLVQNLGRAGLYLPAVLGVWVIVYAFNALAFQIIVNSGIKRIVYREGYPDEFAMKILSEADILVERYEE